MADTYDLAMQLFRLASYKQQIEKNEGKLKPEDELEFTEASFNDFSNSLAKEFSGLTRDEQKEARRLLEDKINTNINEVFSGNSTQGFTLNVQSIRNVINTAKSTIQLEQSSAIKSDLDTRSTNDSNIGKVNITPQEIINNYRQNGDINILFQHLQEMPLSDSFSIIDQLDEISAEGLANKVFGDLFYSELESPIPEPPEEISTMQESASNIISSSKKAEKGDALGNLLEGGQRTLATQIHFKPQNDPRYELMKKILSTSSLSEDEKNAIIQNKKNFDRYFNSALKSVFKSIDFKSLDFKAIAANYEEFGKRLSLYQASIDKRYLERDNDSSYDFIFFAKKLVGYSRLDATKKNMVIQDKKLLAKFGLLCTAINKAVKEQGLDVSSKENFEMYIQKIIPEEYQDIFNYESLGENLISRIADGSLTDILYQSKDEKNISKLETELNDSFEEMNLKNFIVYSKKTQNRRLNIEKFLKGNSVLSKLSEDTIRKITELMVRSYPEELYNARNENIVDKFGSLMFESYLESNLPAITKDKTIINEVMNIAKKSNSVQLAKRCYSNPVFGINHNAEEISSLLGFENTDIGSLVVAVRESAISTYPNPMQFDPDKFIESLKTRGIKYDEGVIRNPNSFSIITKAIEAGHIDFIDEQIFTSGYLTKDEMDIYDFELPFDTSIVKDSKPTKDYYFAQIDTIKDKYGIDLTVPLEEPPSMNYASFINFKSSNEKWKFQENLRSNKLFALEFSTMIKTMQELTNQGGITSFDAQMLEDFKNTYFTGGNIKLAEFLNIENMQKLFEVIKNRDLYRINMVSTRDSENMEKYCRANEEYKSNYLLKSDLLKKKYSRQNTIGKKLKFMYEEESSTEKTSQTIQDESTSNKDTSSLPIIQGNGLLSFFKRFRNNMRNRNKDEGIFTSIRKAFVNAKDNSFTNEHENKTDTQELIKDNQSSNVSSQSKAQLDNFSQSLRKGIDVDNIGIQNTKSNNGQKNSEAREEEPEEEQI